MTDIYILPEYQASPIERNLEQTYYLLAFLKNDPKLTLYFEPREPLIYPSWFQGKSVEKFKNKYQDTEDQLPPSKMCQRLKACPSVQLYMWMLPMQITR